MSEKVTCSFVMDRETYNAYKSIVASYGENVKGNLVRYMKNVIEYETPNAETLRAIAEVQRMKEDPTLYRTYESVDEMMEELLDV